MPTENVKVKFELIPLDKLASNMLEMIDDEQYKYNRAKSPKGKRDSQRALNMIASISYYLEELKNKNETEKTK